eukprot:632226_1
MIDNIDDIIQEKATVPDTIPRSIISEFTEVYGLLLSRKNAAFINRNSAGLKLATNLIYLLPKVVLQYSNGGRECDTKKAKYQRKLLKAFKTGDYNQINAAILRNRDNMKKAEKKRTKRVKEEGKMSTRELKEIQEERRIHRCKRYLKLGYYNKALRQLNEAKQIDLTDPIRWNQWKSKFPYDEEMDHKSIPMIQGSYDSIEVKKDLLERTVKRINAAATGGADLINNKYIQQIFNQNDQQFKEQYRRYIERIINANLSKYERENISNARGVALDKKGKDIRPILMFNGD